MLKSHNSQTHLILNTCQYLQSVTLNLNSKGFTMLYYITEFKILSHAIVTTINSLNLDSLFNNESRHAEKNRLCKNNSTNKFCLKTLLTL